MPRSKRNRIVSLTKTSAKGKDLKTKMVEELRKFVDEYKAVYVLNLENMRTGIMRTIRMDWKESKIYMGKNKVAQIALGRTAEEEYKDNLRNISKRLEGGAALLFTNRERSEVESYFQNFSAKDYATAGMVPKESIEVPVGPLAFPVSMMDELRKLGLVVEVENGTVMLRNAFTAATAGSPLTPEQAKILLKLDRKIVEFKIRLDSSWEEDNFHEY